MDIKSEIAKYYSHPAPFWESIPKDIHNRFKENSLHIKVAKNEIIYSEGSYPRGLYIINKGIARMYMITASGEEQTIYLMTQNEVFGFRPIICNDDSPVFVSAVEDCEIEMVDKEIFLSSLYSSSELNMLFLHYFGNEFRVLCNKITFFSVKPVQERVALSLLILNQKFHSIRGEENVIHFSHGLIANYAGTILETLSRQLKILKDMNAIAMEGRKIILLDLKLLFERANI
jgi:CRP-like cAMP-binding protein